MESRGKSGVATYFVVILKSESGLQVLYKSQKVLLATAWWIVMEVLLLFENVLLTLLFFLYGLLLNLDLESDKN